MNGWRKILIILLTMVICLSFQLNYTLAKVNNREDTKEVLYINSYHDDCEWSDPITSRIKLLLGNKEKDTNLYIEYMDSIRNKSSKLQENYCKYISYKYANKSFDVIIVSDNPALDFINTYGKELFKNTPVVFCGVNNFDKSMIKNYKNITGIVENPNVKGTFGLATSLHKQNKNLVFISDQYSKNIINSEELKGLIKEYSNKYSFKFIIENNINSVISEVNKINEPSILFIEGDFVNDDKNHISSTKAANMVSTYCKFPLYSFWDYYMRNGIVGTDPINAYRQGDYAAKFAQDVLSGKKVTDIPILNNKEKNYLEENYFHHIYNHSKDQPKEKYNNVYKYIIDYNYVSKFNIDLKSNIDKCIIINNSNSKHYITKEALYNISMVLTLILTIIVIILIINVINKKKIAERLLESEEMYEKLINYIPSTILMCCNGKISFVNKSGLDLLELDSEEQIIDKYVQDFVSQCFDFKEGIVEYIKLLQEQCMGLEKVENKLITCKGTHRYVELYGFSFEHKNKINATIIIKDITALTVVKKLKEQADKNERLLMEVKQYDKIKTEFIANMSHELRTPLNVILSTVQLLELCMSRGTLTDSEQKLDKRIMVLKQNAYRLLRLVNNLIDCIKIEDGFLTTELGNYNIVNIIEDICLSVADYIKDKGIEFVFDTDVEEKVIACDPEKLERIILNILSNAIKFTEVEGSIFVNVYDKKDYVEISIRDTGRGIPKEKIDMVFKRFVQVDKSLNRNAEGSGIGLTLVKSLVEMLDGNITLKSELGKGSEFIIKFPVRLVKEKDCDISLNNLDNIKEKQIEKINIEFSDIYN